MTLLAIDSPTEVASVPRARVAELQARINGMQSAPPPSRRIPTRSDLAALLPGGLREGAVYQVRGSTTLAALALSEASAAGRWVAWVGWPRLGAEALAQMGIRLDRTAVVPQPAEHWLAVVSSLVDAMGVIAVRPPRGARVTAGDTARLSARLRERGSSLLIDADWPHADAELRVEHHVWQGLSAGHGLLLDRQLLVAVRDRSGTIRRGHVGVSHPVSRTLRAVDPALAAPTQAPLEGDWAVSA